MNTRFEIEIGPRILERLAEARSMWYGAGKFKKRYEACHVVHVAGTMLYLLEQQLPDGSAKRKNIQQIRNTIESLEGDYAGYENGSYPYKSLLKNPGTRTDEIVKMLLELETKQE